MRDSWMECNGGQGFSFPDDNPVKRIDYLFLTGNIRCTKAEVINSRVSDHRPVLIEIQIPWPNLAMPALSPEPTRKMSSIPFAIPSEPTSSLDPRSPLNDAQRQWVDRTLESLSLRERVGQMINVWVLGDYTNTHDSTFAEVMRWIQRDHIGGVTMSLGSPIEVAAKLNNSFQRAAKVPLMVGSDPSQISDVSRAGSSRTTCWMARRDGVPERDVIAATGREQMHMRSVVIGERRRRSVS